MSLHSTSALVDPTLSDDDLFYPYSTAALLRRPDTHSLTRSSESNPDEATPNTAEKLASMHGGETSRPRGEPRP